MNVNTGEAIGHKLLLSYDECGELMGLSGRSIWTLVHTGQLRACRIGRSVRIPLAELERYIARQTEKGVRDERSA